jgi:acetyltransferase-like isoleucine patch superfamily enzyme
VGIVDGILIKLKRAETPFWRRAKSIAKVVVRPAAPRLPRILRAPCRLLYECHFGVIVLFRFLVTALYRHPLFQARCASVGKNLSLDGMPFVEGHAEIHIGNDVWLGGNLTVSSGRWVDKPRLVLKDRTSLGWNVLITVNKEVVIEEDVRISFDCRISDSDGHPRAADLRAQHAPVSLKDIRPVRICRYAWIGNGSHVMKGVTIGEGAIVGANSVVINDIPPYCLALGNPAEIFFRNYGRPSKQPDGEATALPPIGSESSG